MSLRTLEQLSDFLDSDLAWRKKELSNMHSLLLLRSISESKRSAILRSAVALLYAHWEGYVKSASTAYVEYVALQKLKNENLSDNFIALSLKTILNKATQSNKIQSHIEVASFFRNRLKETSAINYKNAIDTKSNLSSRIFKNIIILLGLDYSHYATKEKLIDEKLLNSRNNIAHGNYLLVDEREYLELNEQIIGMMNLLRNQIDNSSVLKEYILN